MLITDQLDAGRRPGELGAGSACVVASLLALWSASGGIGNLITAINIAYDEEETRGFVKKRGPGAAAHPRAPSSSWSSRSPWSRWPRCSDGLVDTGALRLVLQVARWVLHRRR